MIPIPLLTLPLLVPLPAAELVVVGRYEAGAGMGVEIVSVQSEGRRLALTLSELGAVDVLSLDEPADPRRVARHDLELASGEELTSVAFHPSQPWVFCAVQAAGPEAAGFVSLRAAADGVELARFPAGVGPDSIAIAPHGRLALVANEGEAVLADTDDDLRSPPGSLTVLHLTDEPGTCRARQLELPAFETDEVRGRSIEREVDGRTVLVPLTAHGPAWLEPEVGAFAPDGRRAYVTLQENNALARLDFTSGLEGGQSGLAPAVSIHALGTTRHAADLADDERIAFTDELFALREPDGVAVTPDGSFVVTADEGDTDPKASRTPWGWPAGGGRTVSVFDAETLVLVGDTGDQIDRRAAEEGLYPDGRSDSRGCEPEMIVAFELDGRTHAAATLERADAVVLLDLSDPAVPRVVDLASVAAAAGPEGPEGLAHHRDARTAEHYLYTANEASGALTVLHVRALR